MFLTSSQQMRMTVYIFLRQQLKRQVSSLTASVADVNEALKKAITEIAVDEAYRCRYKWEASGEVSERT